MTNFPFFIREERSLCRFIATLGKSPFPFCQREEYTFRVCEPRSKCQRTKKPFGKGHIGIYFFSAQALFEREALRAAPTGLHFPSPARLRSLISIHTPLKR